MRTIQDIDLTKYAIEIRFTPLLKKIFRHMAEDAKALYLANRQIPVKQLVENYSPEFLKVIRDAQRSTIKEFGFDIREDSETKGYSFKTQKHKALFDFQIENKDEQGEITALLLLEESQIEKVNQRFALDSALFVANSSEEQVAYIDDTNFKEISEIEKSAVFLFYSEQTKLQSQIALMEEEITRLEFEGMLGSSQAIAATKKKRLRERVAEIKKELEDLIKNKDKFVADKIEAKIIERGNVRSPLIASQNVGMAEAWSRQKEAELVSQNVPEIELKKRWESILDNRTRKSHVIADGQVVGADEMFTVGGYQAKNPRAENLPIRETVNCRCVAMYLNQ